VAVAVDERRGLRGDVEFELVGGGVGLGERGRKNLEGLPPAEPNKSVPRPHFPQEQRAKAKVHASSIAKASNANDDSS